ncbi:dynamin family protein [Comamonas aquatica]|uniref:dynamin family protein n=1 Tax=Comamonas aquatica TaxID=225991 RepID=UPI0021B0F3BF|nr:dynamin family protein [Comamonas aquatica]
MHQTNIETLRDEAQRQLQLLKELLQKAQKKGLVDAPAENERDRATFDTESLAKALEVLDGESHKLNNLDMVLAVVGTMKAGKSTSINAIVGAEVLPNRNRPMTALPTLIRHTPGVLQPRLMFEKVKPLNDLLDALGQAVSKAQPETLEELASDADMAELLEQVKQQTPFASLHEGEQGIFQFLKGLNDLVRLCFALEVEFPFVEYATVDAMPVIEVEFSHLKNTPATQGRLTLLDTPGPNEAGQQHLRHMLKDQLKKASAVLAVLDYTQLKSDADAQVRENLLEISGTAKGRMYALVNKFDQKDRNSDDEATVKQYVAQTLMKGEIAGDNVFPVSANQGYLASRARNEIERSGTLKTNESWVKDFAEEAFGRRWEKFIDDPQEVKEGADDLWQESGFSVPLEQVIVEAHQNAALEALRSATSKLSHAAKNAGDFFKANVGALSKDAKALQRNIDNLQQDIDSINQVEVDTEKQLKHALDAMKKGIHSGANTIEEKINKKLNDYQTEGKDKEKAAAEQKENDAKEERNRNAVAVLAKTAKVISETIGKGTGKKSKPKDSKQNGVLEGREVKDRVVTFNKLEGEDGANNFRRNIEESIRHLLQTAERDIQDCIERGVAGFNQDLDRQRTNSLERIQESAQKNLDGFDIEIRLPQPKTISLDTTVAGILKNAVQEKTKQVTHHKRQSGAWGTVCSWFATSDWGWESYQKNEDYYEVDLTLIEKSSQQAVKNLFESAHIALDQDVYPQLHNGLEDFFKLFREKIEHIRGDLMSGIEKHRLDEAQKKIILSDFTQMARETSSLVKDCTALNDSAELLRREEGASVVRAEVLA